VGTQPGQRDRYLDRPSCSIPGSPPSPRAAAHVDCRCRGTLGQAGSRRRGGRSGAALESSPRVPTRVGPRRRRCGATTNSTAPEALPRDPGRGAVRVAFPRPVWSVTGWPGAQERRAADSPTYDSDVCRINPGGGAWADGSFGVGLFSYGPRVSGPGDHLPRSARSRKAACPPPVRQRPGCHHRRARPARAARRLRPVGQHGGGESGGTGCRGRCGATPGLGYRGGPGAVAVSGRSQTPSSQSGLSASPIMWSLGVSVMLRPRLRSRLGGGRR